MNVEILGERVTPSRNALIVRHEGGIVEQSGVRSRLRHGERLSLTEDHQGSPEGLQQVGEEGPPVTSPEDEVLLTSEDAK